MSFYEEVVFPWFLDWFEGPEIRALRARCVAGARGRVLEIGFGTGGTLPHYGSEVESITAVEPSGGMNRRARERIERSEIPVTIVPQAGEGLPFEDRSFDTVVTSLVLCSVSDPKQVLMETRRVLRADGRYQFLEHVAATEAGPRRWQERLNGLSRVLGCGCNLNRETEAMIRDAGFRIARIDREHSRAMPVTSLYPLIVGAATLS